MTEELNRVCQFTCDGFGEEPESAAEFDRRISESKCFKIYKEVEGYYTQPRFGCELKRPRIDRILVPTERLKTLGWGYGILGVECKASNLKIGTVVSQCLDYSRATFILPDICFAIQCNWVFIWPFNGAVGDIASVMDQNRIGGVTGSNYKLLKFKTGSSNMLMVENDGVPLIGRVLSGGKVGSR